MNEGKPGLREGWTLHKKRSTANDQIKLSGIIPEIIEIIEHDIDLMHVKAFLFTTLAVVNGCYAKTIIWELRVGYINISHTV